LREVYSSVGVSSLGRTKLRIISIIRRTTKVMRDISREAKNPVRRSMGLKRNKKNIRITEAISGVMKLATKCNCIIIEATS